MSLEQAVFAVAGLVCIVAAIIAATHRDPRTAGGAFLLTLASLAVLYAGLAAPAVSAAVILVGLFVTVPVLVPLTVPVSHGPVAAGPAVAGAALLIAGATFAIIFATIALGEVPINVSLRSSDGYDVAALRDIVTGRSAAAVGASAVLLIAVLMAARAARRDPQRSP